MKRILIVKTSAMGDIIHTFPVLEYLQARFPEAKIDWVVEEGSLGLVGSHPLVNRAIGVNTKTWRRSLLKKITWDEIKDFYKELTKVSYDVVFDLQGNSKSALITGFAKAKDKVGYSWKSVPEKPNLIVTTKKIQIPLKLSIRNRYLHLIKSYLGSNYLHLPKQSGLTLNPDEITRLESIINGMPPSPKFMVAFGSNWENKRLSEDVLREFLLKLQKKFGAYFIFIWSSAKEKEIADRLHRQSHSMMLGDLSLPLWLAVMQKMDHVIALDSAALHLCGLSSTPSFSVFGPSLAAIYKPEGDRHVAYQGTCPYGKVFDKRCPILRSCKTGACMKNISADRLFEAFCKQMP